MRLSFIILVSPRSFHVPSKLESCQPTTTTSINFFRFEEPNELLCIVNELYGVRGWSLHNWQHHIYLPGISISSSEQTRWIIYMSYCTWTSQLHKVRSFEPNIFAGDVIERLRICYSETAHFIFSFLCILTRFNSVFWNNHI